MRNNVITANAGENQYIKTANAFQYDYGLVLKIEGITLPAEYEVHFCNTGSSAAKTVIGDGETVQVPDEYLRNGEDIHAYLYLKEENEYGYTVYHIHIPVVDRAAIDTEEITPIEHNYIEQAIATAEAAASAAAESASHYPYINDDGYWMVWDVETSEYVNTGVKAHDDNTFNLTIGTVTTLPPGSQATASIAFEHGDAILSLGIPAGESASAVSIHGEASNTSVVNIADGADNFPLDEMRIAFAPIQEGSGVPSPRNIRRISGTDSFTIIHTAGSNTNVYDVPFSELVETVYSGVYYPMTGQLLIEKVFMSKRCVDMDNSNVMPGWTNSGVRDLVGEDIDQVFTGQMLNVGTSYGIDTTDGKDLLYLGYDQYGMRQSDWINTEITVQLCIELPEPIEYMLDPIELRTALGNNIFSVTAGTISYLKYPCDTKKYIDNKIAETQALVLEH